MLRFGPFELDPGREELRRGTLVLRLPNQPLRILLMLVRRAGEVVSREEIQAEIWGAETYVDFEHGINSAIRHIRHVLGDHAETPRYVRTLPRRGYSFIATVERIEHEPVADPVERIPEPAPVASPPPRGRRAVPAAAWTATAIAITLTLVVTLVAAARRYAGKQSSARSIAVQPFRLHGAPIAGVDERSFAEEVRVTLARLPRRHVALVEDPARADVVIDGTIRQTEDGVRAIVSLTDRRSKTRLWSETLLRPAIRKEGLAVDAAHRVMREVARRFLPPPRTQPRLETQVKPSALASYQRARLLHTRAQAYDWMRTRELYEAAIREEPQFAEAWSGLSDLWAEQALRGLAGGRPHAAARAAECARRAIVIQPRNPEAHSTLGLIAAQRDYDLAAAEDALRRAAAADPEYIDARVNLAMVLSMRGQADEALREFTAAQQLDPVELDLTPFEPLLYLHARRYEDARARYREIIAVQPDAPAAKWGLLQTNVAQKNWSEALATAIALRQKPDELGVSPNEAGFLKLYRGFEGALLANRGRFNDYFLAIYYAQIGERDRAFELSTAPSTPASPRSRTSWSTRASTTSAATLASAPSSAA